MESLVFFIVVVAMMVWPIASHYLEKNKREWEKNERERRKNEREQREEYRKREEAWRVRAAALSWKASVERERVDQVHRPLFSEFVSNSGLIEIGIDPTVMARLADENKGSEIWPLYSDEAVEMAISVGANELSAPWIEATILEYQEWERRSKEAEARERAAEVQARQDRIDAMRARADALKTEQKPTP